MPSRRVAYTNGKTCFLEIVQNHCCEPAVSYWNSNYENFVEFMTTTSPEDDACDVLHRKRDSNIVKMCMHDQILLYRQNRQSFARTCEEINETIENPETYRIFLF
ncbi:unnamed protein product [Caenorhabditis brenneri]